MTFLKITYRFLRRAMIVLLIFPTVFILSLATGYIKLVGNYNNTSGVYAEYFPFNGAYQLVIIWSWLAGVFSLPVLLAMLLVWFRDFKDRWVLPAVAMTIYGLATWLAFSGWMDRVLD